jgi:hypothetical protein
MQHFKTLSLFRRSSGHLLRCASLAFFVAFAIPLSAQTFTVLTVF